jgi:hypothetical protein
MGWVTVAASALAGVFGWLGNAWAAGRKITVDSKRTLSQSEGEFREDVLARLDKTERALDECRTSHQECREQTIVLRGEVSLLNDKLTELEQSQAQASLALR